MFLLLLMTVPNSLFEIPKNRRSVSTNPGAVLSIHREPRCSAFVQKELAQLTNLDLQSLRHDLRVIGDAWLVGQNILSQLGSVVYIEGSILQPPYQGDVVTMKNLAGSPYQPIAEASGCNTTHLGFIEEVSVLFPGFFISHSVRIPGTETGGARRSFAYINNTGGITLTDPEFEVGAIYRPTYN